MSDDTKRSTGKLYEEMDRSNSKEQFVVTGLVNSRIFDLYFYFILPLELVHFIMI